MEKEEIIKFAVNIISNGIDADLPLEKIKEGLKEYSEYLSSQGYADKDIFVILNKIDDTLPELIKIAQVYGVNGITNLMLNEPLQKKESNITSSNYVSVPINSVMTDRCGNVVTDSCGNPIPKERVVSTTDSCGNPIIRSTSGCGTPTVSSSSCGGRAMGRSSC